MRKLTSTKILFTITFMLFYAFNLVAQTEGTIKVQSNASIKQLVAKKKSI